MRWSGWEVNLFRPSIIPVSRVPSACSLNRSNVRAPLIPANGSAPSQRSAVLRAALSPSAAFCISA